MRTTTNADGDNAESQASEATLGQPAAPGTKPNGAHPPLKNRHDAGGLSNGPATFDDDARAVARMGPIYASFKRLGLAIFDPLVKRADQKVLYSIMANLSSEVAPFRRTARRRDEAWPGCCQAASCHTRSAPA